jgi:hypothetical protein
MPVEAAPLETHAPNLEIVLCETFLGAGNVTHRLAGVAATERLLDLVGCQLRRSAHPALAWPLFLVGNVYDGWV